MTTNQLQEHLGISRSVAYKLMRSQCFPSMRLNGRFYVDDKKVGEWLEKNQYKEVRLERN